MIVLPLFWDQHDNAQRIDETGFGRRLDTYGFGDEQISDAIVRAARRRGSSRSDSGGSPPRSRRTPAQTERPT